MKSRSEFVAMVAAQLVIDGRAPAEAAADAEALGLNLEHRNIAFWEPEKKDKVMVDTIFMAQQPTEVSQVLEWLAARWKLEPFDSLHKLGSGLYKISISALDKTPSKP